MDGIANHFLVKNALDYRILHMQSQKIFGGDTSADTNFRLAHQLYHCFSFTKRPLLLKYNLQKCNLRTGNLDKMQPHEIFISILFSCVILFKKNYM